MLRNVAEPGNAGGFEGDGGVEWEWEIDVPELDTSVFLIPGERVKNGDERLVVLNTVARSIVEGQRGQHPKYVFTYNGERQKKINDSGWQGARKEPGCHRFAYTT